MRRTVFFPVLLAVLVFGVVALPGAGESSSEELALQAMDEFMAAFNARDPKAWAATLNYPHVRIAGSNVRVWETEEEYADYMDFDAFSQQTGWHHSVWDSKKIVQAGEKKVHIAVQFSRFNADNERISTYESFYVLTNQDGHWGTQARSSFAP